MVVLDVGCVLLPTATEAQETEPAPVSVTEVFAVAWLFNVNAPLRVKVLLTDNVEPDAAIVRDAAEVAPLNVARPPVFVIEIAPVVVENPATFWFAVPAKAIFPPELALIALLLLFVKSAFKVRVLAPKAKVTPELIVNPPVILILPGTVFVPLPDKVTVPGWALFNMFCDPPLYTTLPDVSVIVFVAVGVVATYNAVVLFAIVNVRHEIALEILWSAVVLFTVTLSRDPLNVPLKLQSPFKEMVNVLLLAGDVIVPFPPTQPFDTGNVPPPETVNE